jgi:N-acetylglucosamine kinase-like BadF-type ATPase
MSRPFLPFFSPEDGQSGSARTGKDGGALHTPGTGGKRNQVMMPEQLSGPAENRSPAVFPLLAVDGGGTKTDAVITDKTGKILAKGKGGASNYQAAGEESAAETLARVLGQAASALEDRLGLGRKDYRIRRGVFALAGIDTAKDQTLVEGLVRRAVQTSGIQIEELLVENDALSTLIGATKQSPGVLLIAGTGSIAFAHDGKGNFYRSGGWGHRFGDEGSGYWIGKEAVRAVLRMHDGREKPTVLSDLVLKHLRFDNHEQLYNWAYGPHYSVDEVSALSVIVEQACTLGDPVSRRILEKAASELFLLVEAVTEKAGIGEKSFKLLLLGGVLQNNERIRHELVQKVREKRRDAEILIPRQKPIELIIQRGLYDGEERE